MDVFAHELCGDGIRARRIAERALEITPRNPWAHHALEHVLLWEGNPEAAIVVMERWIADWEASARSIHSHNYWHLALAQLDWLEVEKAFAVFDAQDDIFRCAHIDSLRKSGRDSEANALLKARMAAKTPSPLKESLV